MPALTLIQEDWSRFLTPEGLAEKFSVSQFQFPAMLAKELTDNAMDASTAVNVYRTDDIRPDILRMCVIDKFADDMITQKYLPAFLDENPELTAGWRIAYDKRGSLSEPHTGHVVGLGTVEVDAYATARPRVAFDRPVVRSGLIRNVEPQHRYKGLLFIEKEGFSELITDSGILNRHDAGRSKPVSGEQWNRADLLLERGLDEDAVEFLTGDEPRRVEVNALTSQEFLDMLDDALGDSEKLVPPDTVLADAYAELTIRARLEAFETQLRADTPPRMPDGLRRAVCEALDDDPDMAWDEAILTCIKEGENL